MEIKNKTAYTFDTLLEFQRRHGRGIILAMVILVCVCTGILLCSLGFDLLWFALGLAEAPALARILSTALCLILSVAYIVFVPLSRRFVAHKQAKQNACIEFVFTEAGFTTVSQSVSMAGTTECKYDMIVRVKESKNLFYLYNNARSAFIVAKDGFTEGNEDDFRLLLRTVIDPKKLHIK